MLSSETQSDATTGETAINGETDIAVEDTEALRVLLGAADETRRLIEREMQVKIALRGDQLTVRAADGAAPEAAARAAELLRQLMQVAKDSLGGGRALGLSDVRHMIAHTKNGGDVKRTKAVLSDTLVVSDKGKAIGPRTVGQKAYVEALRRADLVFAIGPAGTGKCIAADSLLLTSGGTVEIGSLGAAMETGEYSPLAARVQGYRGVEEASHIYCGGESDTLRVTTRLGFSIEATPEHPLLCLTAEGVLRWKRADALQVGDVLALARGSRLFGDTTAVNVTPAKSPHDHSSKDVVIETLDEPLCYMLGVLTGDGCLSFKNRVNLSSCDPSIVRAFYDFAARLGLHVFPSKTRPHDHVIASAQLHRCLLQLGMSDGKAATKRVPRSILSAPQPLVAAFLRGLFDADGTAEKRDGTISLSSVSPRLIAEVQVLLLNFGIVAGRALKRGRYKEQVHFSHRLTAAGAEAERFHDLIGFALERKRAHRQAKFSNTNVDLVPHAAALLDASVRSVRLTHHEHRLFYDYRCGRRTPGYAKLGQLTAVLQERGAAREAVAPLVELLRQRFLFLPITEIEPSRARVYDLTVPKTHSFVANGFINHNTYLAVAAAVAALKSKQVSRIILTRPAVEAGENLGFLPGDLEAKVDPYLRPLYDALFEMLDMEKAQKMFERRTIEVAPLAYMRGRTLSEAFIILDEAQNTTPAQMKMFLTRLGLGSKMIVTGDVTQTDLPRGQESGLRVASRVLTGVDNIEFVELGKADVVRHGIVQRIIEAYERDEAEQIRADGFVATRARRDENLL